MARKPAATSLNPVFHEPTFSEGTASADPTGFATRHPSDNAQYAQLKALLKKNVVRFDPSRAAPDGLFRLRDAYGPHGAQIEQAITKAGKIIFHSLGDSGASNAGTYKDEIRVSDQVTLDCQTADEANRPAFLFHLGDIVYSFGEASTTTISSTSPSATTRRRSSPSPATTTPSSSRKPRRVRRRWIFSCAISARRNR
jgi:hypothetical protein